MTTVAVLSFAGFAMIAVSMTRHHHELFGRAPSRRMTLAARTLGWLLLACSLVAAIRDAGPAVGIVCWFGMAPVTAVSVAMLLTYRTWWWRWSA